MAAQVAVTTSLADPRDGFRGQRARHDATCWRRCAAAREPPPLIFASTNKVYGDLADVALVLDDGERYAAAGCRRCARTASARTGRSTSTRPYGCSKGAADQYVLDYARSFGVPTAVLRMSCIYGPRQLGTEDQGWVAHFLLARAGGRADHHLRRRPAGARRAVSSMMPSPPISRRGGGSAR